MISKSLPADSIYHTCRYICNRKEAEVLHVEGVRGHDYKLMAKDFEMQQQMRPSKKVGCFHAVLSFHPHEKPSDAMMVEIAQKYLERLNIVNTQYSITKHTDKKHLHLHVIANMINNDGKSINDSFIGLRGKKIAQKLTQEYKLIPALEKNLALTHLENMSETEVNRYKIYMAIAQNLPHCKTMEELEGRLKKQGIETLYKYKGQTAEKQGISFKIGKYSYKGSQVDRKFSYGNLQKTFALNESQEIDHSEELLQQQGVKGQKTAGQRITTATTNSNSSVGSIGKELGRGMEKAMEILLKPEPDNHEELPYEFSEKYQRKKKQSQKIRR